MDTDRMVADSKMQGSSSASAIRRGRLLRFFRCIKTEPTSFAYKGNHVKIKYDYRLWPFARLLSSNLRNIAIIFDDIVQVLYFGLYDEKWCDRWDTMTRTFHATGTEKARNPRIDRTDSA
jgi:hypothetical protein